MGGGEGLECFAGAIEVVGFSGRDLSAPASSSRARRSRFSGLVNPAKHEAVVIIPAKQEVVLGVMRGVDMTADGLDSFDRV